MSSYLGFQPTTSSPYYFVSYSSEDAAKVGPVAQILSQKIPLWYDYGLTYGERWGKEIADHIENAEAVLVFLSKKVFEKGLDSYVYTEYQMAKNFFQKPIIIIQNESITRTDITNELLGWWIELNRYQNIIRHANTTNESLASQILKAVNKGEEAKPDLTTTVPPQEDLPEKQLPDASITAAPLLKYAFMYLKTGKWYIADRYCDKALDVEPENASAYLGKLMAELQVHRQEDLANCAVPFDSNHNYKMAVRYGDEEMASTLNGYLKRINDRKEYDRFKDIYSKATHAMNSAASESDYRNAARLFESIPGFKYADALAAKCHQKAEAFHNDVIYSAGIKLMNLGGNSSISKYAAAIEQFSKIRGWKDTDERILICQKKIREIEAKKKL